MSPKKRKKMVSKRVDISLSRQCKILRISRSSLYYTPMAMCSRWAMRAIFIRPR